MQLRKLINILIFLLIIIIPLTVGSQTVDELNQKIKSQEEKIRQLDKEIEAQRQKVLQAGSERKTVESVVNELEATKKKIETNIRQTQAQINESELVIQKLGIEIGSKTLEIEDNHKVIGSTLRKLYEFQTISLLEILLVNDKTSSFWNKITELESFNKEVKNKVEQLHILNGELRNKQKETEDEKKELEKETRELSGEKESVEETKKEKAVILNQVKKKELTYQQILNQKVEEKKKFEQELLDFESQLQIILDKSAFPNAKDGIIQWPLDNVVLTQEFGGTQFAKTNPGVYGRPFHNGTDFGTPIGTKVKAVLGGTIQGTGNTDAFPGCHSWGKWILLKHDNGLTSLYAHLSSIIVSPGQRVSVGETIGFSGNTGVSTGPHLHLTLYASQGVSIRQFSEFKSGSGCAATGATTPTAPLDAYLDPMDYLPK